MNWLEQLARKGGTFKFAHHEVLPELGATVQHIAIPTVSSSKGLKAHWMEIYCRYAEGSLGGARWNLDVDPDTNYAYLPPQTLVPYALKDSANTLYVRADGVSTYFEVNFFLVGP